MKEVTLKLTENEVQMILTTLGREIERQDENLDYVMSNDLFDAITEEIEDMEKLQEKIANQIY